MTDERELPMIVDGEPPAIAASEEPLVAELVFEDDEVESLTVEQVEPPVVELAIVEDAELEADEDEAEEAAAEVEEVDDVELVAVEDAEPDEDDDLDDDDDDLDDDDDDLDDDDHLDDDDAPSDSEPPDGVVEDDHAADRHARRVHWERPTRIAVASLALIAIMFLFVFPTRSYLAQQRQVGTAQQSVKLLRAQNKQLAREARRLQTRTEIERMARVQFNMVLPGEQAYNVVSDSKSAPTTTAPG